MINRAIIIVLDGLGVGELPDAKEYNDEGSNTLVGIRNNTKLEIPNMRRLGLYNIDGLEIPEKETNIKGCYGKLAEMSKGKNSPVGHWEIGGYITINPFKTYKDAFPKEMINEFIKEAKIDGVLGNEVASGTEILARLGEEHIKTGFPIIYTSADSVFQIAACEEIVPIEKLYEWCRIARKILDKPEYNIGAVIARPFIGDNKDNFKRTYNRRDFNFAKFGKTMLDVLYENKKNVTAIGKIEDLFVGRGMNQKFHTEGNLDGIKKTIEEIEKENEGLIFTNLVDFDMLYGHRNDIQGYAKALEEFDNYLPEILQIMKDTDMLIITADHGNDPSTPSTDHSREYVPILVTGKHIKDGINLGTRATFADISATILDIFDLPKLNCGTSFKEEILN